MPRYVTRGRKTRQARYRKRAPTRKYRRPTRPSYRRRKSGGMSKRQVLNTTSRKKRNGMLSWSNTNNTAASQSVGLGDAYVNSGGGFFVWCATGQTLDTNSIIPNQASRTATTCYMRGLSEHLRIQTSSGIPWLHRRICFTLKGINAFNTLSAGDTPTQKYVPIADTTNGIERLWFNEQINAMSVTLGDQWGILFKGANGRDWNNLILAPVDTSRVSLKFDKTYTISSGNTNGVFRERKLWHPMNKNLVYDDDESADAVIPSNYSVDSKAGMGDYYIVDIIQPGTGATTNDYCVVSANSTLYWHEK